MANKKLHVMAKPGVLVMCPEAMAGGLHRYVGMRQKMDPVEDPMGRADFYEVIPEGVHCEMSGHVREAVKRGELVAMDEYTAKLCKVDWKPAAPAKK